MKLDLVSFNLFVMSTSTSLPVDHTKRRVEDQLWFHGALPREEINKLLQKDGQFLVRVSQKKEGLLCIISVRQGGSIHHIVIRKTTHGKFYLGDGEMKFESIYSLIKYYCLHKVPLGGSGAVLKDGVRKRKWLLNDRDLEMMKKLGEGSFGEVWMGYLTLKDGGREKVAIKKCKEGLGPINHEENLEEAKLMMNFEHRNVVRVLGVAADRPPIRIVMEYCPTGSLKDYLIKMRAKKMSESQKIRYCLEAATGMDYLSSMKCIHRDLAARNCLLGSKGEVKISDFGMSKSKKMIYKEFGAKIPVRWTAPESFTQGRYSEKSDVWSFGVLMWEIFADGAHPWPHIPENKEVMQRVINGERMKIPVGTPPIIITLMQNCWKAKPSTRISFIKAKHTLQVILSQ